MLNAHDTAGAAAGAPPKFEPAAPRLRAEVEAERAAHAATASRLEAALREMPNREQKRILDRLRLDLPALAAHRDAHAWLSDLCG